MHDAQLEPPAKRRPFGSGGRPVLSVVEAQVLGRSYRRLFRPFRRLRFTLGLLSAGCSRNPPGGYYLRALRPLRRPFLRAMWNLLSFLLQPDALRRGLSQRVILRLVRRVDAFILPPRVLVTPTFLRPLRPRAIAMSPI
jgi:hypothetical protein